MLTRFGEAKLTSLLSLFSCPKNPDVEDFLATKAIRFEETGNARTRLILDEQGQILAYFSISFKELLIDGSQLSKNQIRKMDGFSKNAKKIRSYLIGQLGKNAGVANNPITLGDILNDIYTIIDEAKALVGGRIIILECENNERLIGLYKNHGFKKLNVVHDDNDYLITMYTYITQ